MFCSLTCVLIALAAVALDPKAVADALHHRGHEAFTNGKLDAAIADLTRALELDPKGVKLWHNRGSVWAAKREYEKAIADYTKAAELDPSNPKPLTARGDVKFALKEFDKAIDDYSKAIDLHPLHDEAYRSRGNVLFQQGEFRKATADFSKLIEIDPKDAESHYSRGLARHATGDHADAVTDLVKATELDPKDADAWSQLALLYATCPAAKHRDGAKAVACGTKAVALRPTDHRVRESLATAHAAAGDFDAAVEQQGKALQTEGMTEAERDAALWRLDRYKLKETWWDDE